MTPLQKEVITLLLRGHRIFKYPSFSGGKNKCRIRDNKNNPVRNISDFTFGKIKEYLRKEDNYFVIDKRVVRGLRKNHSAKKLYTQCREKH